MPAPEPKPQPLSELLEGLHISAVQGEAAAVAVRHVTHDSRLVSPGSVFVAYAGVYENVHDYIPDAVARGAAAVIAEEAPVAVVARLHGSGGTAGPGFRHTGDTAEWPSPAAVAPVIVHVPDARLVRGLLAARLYGEPSNDLVVIGVTGTDGKTTTATLCHNILEAAGRNPGLVSTIEARVGNQALDTGLHVTTPEPEQVQAYLRAMVDVGCDVAVLEVTSHGLAQHRVAGVAFDVGVITNITHEALEYHGTFEAYTQAKAKLFHMLAQREPKEKGPEPTAVLNAGDPSFDRLASIPVTRKVSYSLTGEADFTSKGIRHGADGLRLVAETPSGRVEVNSPLVGAYNAANILAAMAATYVLGCGPREWAAGVANTRAISGRMEPIDEGQTFMALVDFAHTPNGLRHALTSARELTGPQGRVIVVFGCAGLRDPGKRAQMGSIAAELADFAVVTAEDPRTEDLSAIIDAVAEGLEAGGRVYGEGYTREADRAEAIRVAVAEARAGDVVIVCGKGHEQSLAIGTIEYPWDDRDALRAALREERYHAGPGG